MIKCCKHCNHTHPGTDARAIGRFTPGGPLGYKANYEGSPLRATREEAKQDMCQWRQEQNRKKKTAETQNNQNNPPTIPEQGEHWSDTANEISDALDTACTELENRP